MSVISAKQVSRRRVFGSIGVISFAGVIAVVIMMLSITRWKVWAEGGSATEPIIVRGYDVTRGIDTLGSLSILCPAESPFVMLSSERPGDGILMTFSPFSVV